MEAVVALYKETFVEKVYFYQYTVALLQLHFQTHADKLKEDLDSIPSLSDDEGVEYDWNPPISDKKLVRKPLTP